MKIISLIHLAFFLCINDGLAFPPEDSVRQKGDEKKVSFSAYPAAGYAPETSVQLGAIGFIVMDNENGDSAYYRPTSISPYVLYTFNNQLITAFDLDIYFNNGFNLNSKVRYYKYPDFYFGIGNSNAPEDMEMYVNEFMKTDGRLLKPLNDKWFVGLNFNLQYNTLYRFEEGGQLENEDFTGRNGGWMNGLGLIALYDSRNSTLYPTKGGFARAGFVSFSKYLGSEYDFAAYLVEVKKFWAIRSEKNVIGWQGAAAFTSGNDVPIYALHSVGGDDKLRGIENANLYIDRQMWFTQVEYRRDLFWRLGAVLFAGAGDVASSIGDYRLQDLKYVVGVGGRFQALKNERFNVRLDIGIARGGQRAVYVSVREAF